MATEEKVAISGATESSMYLYPEGINLYMGKATGMLTRVGHSPTLNTVLMVEELLSKAGEPVTVAELRKRLPKQVMRPTLMKVLDYLQESGKILITTKGIVWIFAPRPEIEAMKRRGVQL